ncbi:MAG: winged helix-turn-helix transcriptional regulator [Conexibacter sp.]|nr:winged helix-turn-helix transcriptional regulator [Conexibacter sp.]
MSNTEKQRHRRRTLRHHPTRERIVDALRSAGVPLSPARLSEVTGETLGATAYHVRTLRDAGIVVMADEGRVRGAVEHFYALAADEDATADWNDPVAKLQAACDALTLPNPRGGLPSPASLDEHARDELVALLDKIRPKVHKIVSDAANRHTAPKA